MPEYCSIVTIGARRWQRNDRRALGSVDIWCAQGSVNLCWSVVDFASWSGKRLHPNCFGHGLDDLRALQLTPTPRPPPHPLQWK